jgi:hypothetical protein
LIDFFAAIYVMDAIELYGLILSVGLCLRLLLHEPQQTFSGDQIILLVGVGLDHAHPLHAFQHLPQFLQIHIHLPGNGGGGYQLRWTLSQIVPKNTEDPKFMCFQ